MIDIPLYEGKRKNILVISGGGLKFFSSLGAVKALKELEIIDKPDIYCGTSSGSIISLLLNIGYTAEEIYEVFFELDFTTFIEYNYENILDEVHFGLGKPDKGVYAVSLFMKNKKIKKKITFKELFDITKSKLIITGTCVNDENLYYFSVDTTPDMPVLTAIKITTAIPIIFTPCEYDNKIWVDGGCLNNYPIDYFSDKLSDVVGIYMGDSSKNIEIFEDIPSYILKVFKCIIRGLDYNKVKIFEKYTIYINCTSNIATKWDINKEEKKYLHDLGYDAAIKKFSN
jgi:hypothetical protein